MTLPTSLPPLPASGIDFSIDDQFKGASASQDRVIEALHKGGWTLHRVYTAPNAMLPLPETKFPAGRVYLFADDVAVVVQKSNGRIIASLPTRAALRTLHEFTPDVLAQSNWASEQWRELEALEGDFEPHRRHHRQNFFLKDGTRWTVERTEDGRARVTCDGAWVATVDSADEAENSDMHVVLVELIDYVLRNP